MKRRWDYISPWADGKRNVELRALWQQGLSSAEIARKMKMTKNQVIGRAHRIKVPPRQSPIRSFSHVPRPAPAKGGESACRFIKGDPLKQFALGKTYDQIICGRPVKELGAPYCADHHAICWLAPPKRNNKPFIDLQSRPHAESAPPKGRKAA